MDKTRFYGHLGASDFFVFLTYFRRFAMEGFGVATIHVVLAYFKAN